jgi:hypothetical protein
MYGFGISLYQTKNATFTESPVNNVEPFIVGQVVSRATVKCDPGEWDYVTSDFSYQWLLDGRAASGGTEQSYTINTRDIGKVLSCNVSASNISGTIEVETRGTLIER